MRAIPIVLLIILFSVILGVNESFSDSACKTGLELIFKASNNSPACVKPSTATKLVERGWGFMPTDPAENSTNACQLEPDSGLCRAAFQKYYFNQETSLCEQFIWGGCAGIVPFDKLSDCQAQCEPIQIRTSTNVIDANNQFAVDFYSQVANNNDDNLFFSPWSISTAAAIVYEGARGNTADEMRIVFEFPKDNLQRRAEFASILDDLNEPDAKYKLQVANALWIANEFEPLQEYVDTAKNYYDSEVRNVNFISEEGVNTINEWVKDKTEEKIQKIFEPGSTDGTWRLAVTNAIYFKGLWENQFSKDRTIDRDFEINSETKVIVPMMHLSPNALNYTENEQIEILEMPYQGNKTSMLILLPKNVDGINSLDESLTIENLSQWKSSLSERHMAVILPKFTLETEYDLKKKLLDMGIKDAFDPNNADFSGITELESLVISKAIHKAFVDVNEEGTEAAAVTGFGMEATSVPPTFNANHPFVFIIQDTETGNILFMGRMINPLE